MLWNRLFTLLFLLLSMMVCVTGCSGDKYSSFTAPACRISAEFIENDAAELVANQGSCIIKFEKRLVVLDKHHYKLPSSSSSEACDVHRDVFQRTGFNVEIVTVASASQDTIYYNCVLDSAISKAHFPRKTEAGDTLILIDPYSTDLTQWRRPSQLVPILDGFVNAQPSVFMPVSKSTPMPMPEQASQTN